MKLSIYNEFDQVLTDRSTLKLTDKIKMGVINSKFCITIEMDEGYFSSNDLKKLQFVANLFEKSIVDFIKADTSETYEESYDVERVPRWYYVDQIGTEHEFKEGVYKIIETMFNLFVDGGYDSFTYSNEFSNLTITFEPNPINFGTVVNNNNGKEYGLMRKLVDITHKSGLVNYTLKRLEINKFTDYATVLPENWTDIENLSFQTSKFNTILLDMASDEAQEINDTMKKSMENIEIVSIERIQHPVAYKRYSDSLSLLKHKHQNTNLYLENTLFHGTNRLKPFEIINSENGFDIRNKNSLNWCDGIYFSYDMNYVNNLAYKVKSNNNSEFRQIFLASVLVGKSEKLDEMESSNIPPFDNETGELFDSINGIDDELGGHIYCIQDNGRSYPKYLITYQVIA